MDCVAKSLRMCHLTKFLKRPWWRYE